MTDCSVVWVATSGGHSFQAFTCSLTKADLLVEIWYFWYWNASCQELGDVARIHILISSTCTMTNRVGNQSSHLQVEVPVNDFCWSILKWNMWCCMEWGIHQEPNKVKFYPSWSRFAQRTSGRPGLIRWITAGFLWKKNKDMQSMG